MNSIFFLEGMECIILPVMLSTYSNRITGKNIWFKSYKSDTVINNILNLMVD